MLYNLFSLFTLFITTYSFIDTKLKIRSLRVLKSAGVVSLMNDAMEFGNKILKIKDDLNDNNIPMIEKYDFNSIIENTPIEKIDYLNYSYFIRLIKHSDDIIGISVDKDAYFAYIIENCSDLNNCINDEFHISYVKMIPMDLDRIMAILLSHDINVIINN